MNVITIYDCGPEQPPVCFDGNDQVLGVGSKDAFGRYTVDVSPALVRGQIIYAVDGCFDPPLIGVPVRVRNPAPAPLLTPWAIGVGLSLLVLIGRRRLSA